MKIEILKQNVKPNFHRVQKGETLEEIAKIYGKSKFILRSANMLDDDYKLQTGDLLIVDSKNTTYVVKPLDTLKNIAERFCTSTEKIKEKNNIDDNLFIGQILII